MSRHPMFIDLRGRSDHEYENTITPKASMLVCQASTPGTAVYINLGYSAWMTVRASHFSGQTSLFGGKQEVEFSKMHYCLLSSKTTTRGVKKE